MSFVWSKCNVQTVFEDGFSQAVTLLLLRRFSTARAVLPERGPKWSTGGCNVMHAIAGALSNAIGNQQLEFSLSLFLSLSLPLSLVTLSHSFSRPRGSFRTQRLGAREWGQAQPALPRRVLADFLW